MERKSRSTSVPKAVSALRKPVSDTEPLVRAQAIFALGRLKADQVIITSLLPTWHDGLPHSDGRSEDPGVAVWCRYNGRERVFACDQWQTHAENLRAISLSIEAMRGPVHWGMAEVAEHAFAGSPRCHPLAESAR